jgi:hypothetical protein
LSVLRSIHITRVVGAIIVIARLRRVILVAVLITMALI